MTDYIRDIPNGTMMIRDTGGNVEFWFKTGSSTFNNEQNWGFRTNDGYQEYEYRMVRGGNWQNFGAVYVSYRQNVMFRIVGEGLGWGTTDFEVFIERARQPDAPRQPYLLDVHSDALRVAFDYNYDGGLPIVEARLWYSYDGQARFTVGGRDAWVGGLAQKTYYNFWGEVRNDRGWSGLGQGNTYRTIGVPDQPPPPDVTAISPTQTRGGFSGYPWDGGTPVREWQMGWGIDPTYPQYFQSGTTADFDNLLPGRLYYFWARGRNDVGWGPWSARKDVALPAGAWVQVNGVWRRALPWVKSNGSWKISRPFIKENGIWRQAKS